MIGGRMLERQPMTPAIQTADAVTFKCGHCGERLERDAVLFRPVPHDGCSMTLDHLGQMEKLLEDSNPFVPGISIRRSDLFALVAEIKTLRALLRKE